MNNSINHPIREKFNISIIKENINEIKLKIDELKEKDITKIIDLELEMMNLFPKFYQEYPFLVKKICKGDDLSILYKMLDNLNKVDNGEESFLQVESKLSTELADQFITPKIKKN